MKNDDTMGPMTDAVKSWSKRYEDEDTPWDLGRPHPDLTTRLPELLGYLGPGRRVFVPGCGRGHDAEALARTGLEVMAVDVVPGLASRVRTRLEPFGGEFGWEDALLHRPDEAYDLLWEHTFFCAIGPDDRHRYGDMARRCLRRGGILAGVLFPVGKPAQWGGPPWGVSVEALEQALGSSFRRLRDEPAAKPIEARSWKERWIVFKKTGD